MPKVSGKCKDKSVETIRDKRQASILDLFGRNHNKKRGIATSEEEAVKAKGVRSKDDRPTTDDSDDDVQVISVTDHGDRVMSKYFSPKHSHRTADTSGPLKSLKGLTSKSKKVSKLGLKRSSAADVSEDARPWNRFSPSKAVSSAKTLNSSGSVGGSSHIHGDKDFIDRPCAFPKRKLSSTTDIPITKKLKCETGRPAPELLLGVPLQQSFPDSTIFVPSISQSSNKENANMAEGSCAAPGTEDKPDSCLVISDSNAESTGTEEAAARLSELQTDVESSDLLNPSSDIRSDEDSQSRISLFSLESQTSTFPESQVSSQESFIPDSRGTSIESQDVVDNPQYQPYYIENFKLVIETVLEDEFFKYLFDTDDLHSLDTFRFSLSDEAQKLYVRLFLRKHKWLCLRKIRYPKIASDLTPFLKELVNMGFLADESYLKGLEACLNLLPADELRGYAKKMHVDVTNQRMPMIVEALMKQSRRKTVGAMFGMKNNLEATMLRSVKDLVGPCYRLQEAPRLVFLRCMMLFSLTSTTFDDDEQANSQQLFQILQVNRGLITYPEYNIQRKTKIFRSKEDLVRFQTALNIYSEILGTLESHTFEAGVDLYKKAKLLYAEHCADEGLIGFESSLPTFLRVYTAGSMFVRVLNQGVEVLQKTRNYTEANAVLEELLGQSVHCQHYRGHWWDRLALNWDQHLKRPDESLGAIRQGLADPCVKTGRRLALFQRAQKICESPSNKKLKKRLKEFKHASVREAPKVTIQGRLLPKSILGANSHFVSPDSADGSSQDVTLCRVEQVAIAHYKREGYDQGIHGESSTFFVLLYLYFWDIIFMEGISDVFYNKYQTAPLDMRSEEFYNNRKRPIDKRLKWLRKASEEELLNHLEETWTQHEGKMCSGLNWERFESLEQAKTLAQAFGGDFMSGVFKRIVKDPRHTSSGMPDLVVWNTTDHIFRLVEVKGPGDKLSTKQILWLDYFLSLGATAEVCHVVGIGAKKLRQSIGKESQEKQH